MVDKDKKDDRQKRRYDLEARIGRTDSGNKWLQRISQIGKDYSRPLDDEDEKEDDGEDTTSS